MNVLFVYPNINGFHYDNYHFGLASLVSVTRKEKHNVKVVIISEKNEYNHLLDEVKSFKPVVIGFSSVSSQFNYVKEMAALIKELFPSITIVCGGVHPTINTDALLETEVVNGFFVGESELSFIEFLNKIEKGESFKNTDNFAYVQDGRVVRNKLKNLLEDLNLLPHPDKEIYPYKKTITDLGYAPFFFARGCPYMCTYCSNHALAKLYGRTRNYPRFRSPETCILEIEEVMEKYGKLIKFVWIMDDIFGLNNKWREEFCEKYKSRIKKKFMILIRVEMANENLFDMLKDAGCFRVFFGVESGNDKVRSEIMGRKMSNDEIINAFDLCHQRGLETLAVNIIGMPGESEKEILDTVKLNRGLHPTDSGVNIFYPYKGTELGDKCFKEGLVDEERFLSFSNERRETVLRYSEKHKKMLSYYYDNWEILVDPYNIKLRLVKFLKTIGMFEFVRKTKKMLLSRLEVLQKA
ncbi:MAG: B12-binding domain-containing radical SAM protein [Candidatus Brocadiaceae bacterium]|nr:B12-binding domain-containing radical SAM protein [Candidatus Brocadiaceae bacterium]